MVRRIISIALVCSLMPVFGTGCIGHFGLSGKVRAFNMDVAQSKWGREGVFLLLYIIPVYPISGLIDIVLLNSIEFWSGTNPVNGKPRLAKVGDTRVVEGPDGSRAVATLRKDRSIDIELFESDGAAHFVNIMDRDGDLVARDALGNELGSVSKTGDLVLSDPQLKALAALNAR